MAYSDLVKTQRDFFLTGEPATLAHRREQLRRLRAAIVQHQDALAEAVYADLRRDARTTYGLEIGNALVEIDYMLANLAAWTAPTMAQRTLTTALDTPMIVKDAKGVVLIIAPWNYPVSMVLLPLIPAIAAGNTVVVKPSELAPHTADAFDLIFSKTFDKRFLAVVKGGVPETTALLEERFDHILYTGCPPVAKIVMRAAAAHLTPVTLELGGKCPVVVEADADIAIAARRIAWGKWLNNGQTCLAPDYVLTTAALKPRLVDGLRKALVEFYGADVRHSPDYSRIVNTRHFDRLRATLAESRALVLFRGGDFDRDDLFVPPTILDAQKDDAIMLDEIFGPVLPIVTVADLGEAIDFIKRGEKPLAAYIFTRDNAKVQRLLTETSSGGVTVNDVLMHITVDTLPFGGVGTSGMGRYRGKFGFDTFTHEKAVLKRAFFGESFQAARYPPQTDKKAAELRLLTGTRLAVPAFVWEYLAPLALVVVGALFGVFVL